jgi:aromatic ring hydroxylase
VDDVTTHPAFRNAAQTLATVYDRKRAPEFLRVDKIPFPCRDL